MPDAPSPWNLWGSDSCTPSVDQIAARMFIELVAITPPVESDEQFPGIAKECARQAYLFADALIRERDARIQARVLN